MSTVPQTTNRNKNLPRRWENFSPSQKIKLAKADFELEKQVSAALKNYVFEKETDVLPNMSILVSRILNECKLDFLDKSMDATSMLRHANIPLQGHVEKIDDARKLLDNVYVSVGWERPNYSLKPIVFFTAVCVYDKRSAFNVGRLGVNYSPVFS